jgi:LysM repeat protein
MSSLKNLFFLAILAAAAVGAYLSIYRNTESTVPPEVAQSAADTGAAPKVEVPSGTAAPAFSPAPSRAVQPVATTAAPAAPQFGPAASRPSGGAVPADAPSFAPSRGGGVAANPALQRAAPPSSGFTGQGIGTSPAAAPAPSSGSGSLTLPSDAFARPTSSSAGRDAVPPVNTEAVMQAVEAKLDQNRLADAHLALSALYNRPEVPADKSREINRLLDQMAATVIYSRQHLLDTPYRVQPGDTLERVAQMYNVPAQLLARINGIRDPQNLPPNRELKVIHGPFDALVSLGKAELTLMLKGRYAGRFAIATSADLSRLAGNYIVRDKRAVPEHAASTAVGGFGRDGAGPTKLLIDLGDQLAIQSTRDLRSGSASDGRGTIFLGNQEMEDVFGILSVGSNVVIQR